MSELLKKEITLQWRQGFWLVYFILTAIYTVIQLNIPSEGRLIVSLFVIHSDTSMLGAIFMGALVLLEKQQNVIQALFVTPLSPASYIRAKTLSLSLIAITMSILVYLPTHTFTPYTLLLFASIALTAAIFAMMGLGIAAGVSTVNGYFGNMIAVSLLIAIPIVPYMLLGRHAVFLILPFIASLDLMLGAVDPLPVWRIILDFTLLLGWGLATFRYTLSRVNRHMVFI
jgi:fluoroquinolone transport system permease protein